MHLVERDVRAAHAFAGLHFVDEGIGIDAGALDRIAQQADIAQQRGLGFRHHLGFAGLQRRQPRRLRRQLLQGGMLGISGSDA